MSKETYKLSTDLKFIEQQPTMSEPEWIEGYVGGVEAYGRDLQDYKKYLQSLKKYEADGFNEAFLNRELENNVDFATFKIPDSNGLVKEVAFAVMNKKIINEPIPLHRDKEAEEPKSERPHRCQYCGVLTTKPDEECILNPNPTKMAMVAEMPKCGFTDGNGKVWVEGVDFYFRVPDTASGENWAEHMEKQMEKDMELEKKQEGLWDEAFKDLELHYPVAATYILNYLKQHYQLVKK